MYENVNDPHLRSNLRKAWGFCNWHCSLLKKVQDSGFGTSILYADFLKSVLEEAQYLEKPWSPLSWFRQLSNRLCGKPYMHPFLKVYRTKTPCPLCVSASDAEQRYLHTILEFAEDPQFAQAYEKSDGLCLPHLVMALEIGHNCAGLKGVVNPTLKHWKRLHGNLKSFRDKHDWRNTLPFTPEESRSPHVALDTLTGMEGLFGNEIRGQWQETAPLERQIPFPSGGSEIPPEDAETLQFEKGKLELQIKELRAQLHECMSQRAALNYRLWEVTEDRNILEMHLTGERGNVETNQKLIAKLRQKVEGLEKELEQLKESRESSS